VALLLAAIGIYGVMSYAVSQRTSEIGIRLALGLSRAITTELYETSAADPITFVGVVGILGAVAALATYLPARRASRIAPVEALRYQ
jgi:putative ABC transport system permease protein